MSTLSEGRKAVRRARLRPRKKMTKKQRKAQAKRLRALRKKYGRKV